MKVSERSFGILLKIVDKCSEAKNSFCRPFRTSIISNNSMDNINISTETYRSVYTVSSTKMIFHGSKEERDNTDLRNILCVGHYNYFMISVESGYTSS